jgi:hypothetical protein
MVRLPAAFLLLAAAAMAADPPAPGWGAFGPGSWVVLRTVSALEGQDSPRRTEVVVRYTLLAKQGGRATLQVERTLFGNTATSTVEVPVAAALPQGDAGSFKRGEETLTLAGQALKCTWHEAAVAGEGRIATTRAWLSPAIPGGVVRILVLTAGQAQTQAITEAIAWEKK